MTRMPVEDFKFVDAKPPRGFSREHQFFRNEDGSITVLTFTSTLMLTKPGRLNEVYVRTLRG